MATAGTNITSIAKPGIGTTTGPQWATDLNTSLDAIDGHDHSTGKGIRITPAGININADLEFNQNSATELKNVIFDSSVTAATTSYSVYQASGNLYWRNGSGTAVQITTGSSVNAGAGSISGMTSTDAGVTYSDGSKTFNFFTDSGNEDYGKMAHADLLLFKYTNDNSGDTDYVTIAANAAASGSSGTIYVPSENGTFLTTATNYAGAINIATSNSNNNIALKPNETGFVEGGKGCATGKVTSNGAYDLILSTNSGTNSSYITITDAANGNISLVNNGTGEVVIGSGAAAGKLTTSGAHDLVLDTNAGTNSGTITITDAADGNIDITPNGTGEVNISKVDIDGGTLAAITIDGNWTAASQTCANLGSVTTADINGGTIDGTTVGASSHTTGKFTTCDATTDFTIGGLVLTDGNIADTGTLALVPVDGCTIALGSDAGDDFNVDSGKFVVEGDTGNVGIGTASPISPLSIKRTPLSNLNAASHHLNIGSDVSGNNLYWSIGFGYYSGSHQPAYIGYKQIAGSNYSKGDLIFGTRGNENDEVPTERMRIASDGKVGISTTSPSYGLHVGSGQAQFEGSQSSSDRNGIIIGGSSTGSAILNVIQKSSHTGEILSVGGKVIIYASGNAVNANGSWGQISDIKLKENIVDATDKLADILKVKVKNFNFKNNPEIKQIGVVAQELETIFPAMVEDAIDKDDKDKPTGTVTKSVKYSVFVPMLIKAIQELSAKVTALENA